MARSVETGSALRQYGPSGRGRGHRRLYSAVRRMNLLRDSKTRSAFASLQLALELLDSTNVVYFCITHFAELGDSGPAADTALAVHEERSGFVMQEIDCIVNLLDRDVSAPADVSAAILVLAAHIEKDGALGCPAAVDFFVNIYRLEKIQKRH